MNNQDFLTKSLFEKLINHLVNIEDEKNVILEEYFPGYTKERKEIEALFNNYIARIDWLIANKSEIIRDSDKGLPFVIIYSDVIVRDLNTFEVYDFRIVPPFKNSEINDVSYLSPVGKSLLLKNVGDVVTIKTPGGKISYQIQSIKFNP